MLNTVRKLFQRDARAAAAPLPVPKPVVEWRTLGNDALAAGDLERAASYYLQGTRPPPGHPMAWLNLGYVQIERGEHEQARVSLRTAESLMGKDDPALLDVWALMGRAHQECGELDAAAAAYSRVVARTPTHAGVWRELGQISELQGQDEAAEIAYTRAVGVQGDFEPALRDLARLLVRLRRDSQALPFIERCLALRPVHPETVLLHAVLEPKSARWADALAAVDAALQGSDDLHLTVLRARALLAMGRSAEALACHDSVLARQPNHVECLAGSARALGQLLRWPEAMARIDRALALDASRADIVHTKASLLGWQLRRREALEVLEQAEGSAREAADNRFLASVLHLLHGDYAAGWAAYESRWGLRLASGLNRKRDCGVPEWEGEPLPGRTLTVYAEQGLGDTIQFLRFLPQVAARVGKVLVHVQPPLQPVLGQLPPNCELVSEDAMPPFDSVCPLMSLPRVLGNTLENLPPPAPYLRASAGRLAHWNDRLGPRSRKFRVGVAWSGNPEHTNDANRSMSLATLKEATASFPDVEFISLQKDLRASDEEALRSWPEFRHFGPEISTFDDTAALAHCVDLVMSVDTSVAHLVGSLGRPLSVLLPYNPDWRWLLERDDSPWYPTARLYRQPAPLEWGPALAAAMADIAHRADQVRSSG